jgi:hypothetical protein
VSTSDSSSSPLRLIVERNCRPLRALGGSCWFSVRSGPAGSRTPLRRFEARLAIGWTACRRPRAVGKSTFDPRRRDVHSGSRFCGMASAGRRPSVWQCPG